MRAGDETSLPRASSAGVGLTLLPSLHAMALQILEWVIEVVFVLRDGRCVAF